MALTFIRFMTVGGSGLLVNSATLFVLYQQLGLPFVWASAVSVELAIANNFIWNDGWTFRRRTRSISRFVRFNLISLGGLIITSGTAWLLIQRTEVNYLVANLVGASLAAMCSFAANLTWTWRT